MAGVSLPHIGQKKFDVAPKIGTEGPRVSLRKLVIHHAEKSALDHFDVKLKTDFGPTSPGVHVAPKLGPGFNSGTLTPRELNEKRERDKLRLGDELEKSRMDRSKWVPPPHMGIGSEPSRVPVDPKESMQRKSVVKAIALKSQGAQQMPLTARPSVADHLSGACPVAPPKALTARTTKAPLPAAGYSFPRPSSGLKAAAHAAAAEDAFFTSTDAAPSILVGEPTSAPPVPKPPQKPSFPTARRQSGNTEPSSPAASLRSHNVSGTEGPAKTAAEVLQQFLPALFPVNPRASRKRGALKAMVKTQGADGQDVQLPPVAPETISRRRGSVAVTLAPVALDQGRHFAAHGHTPQRTPQRTPSEAPILDSTRAFASLETA